MKISTLSAIFLAIISMPTAAGVADLSDQPLVSVTSADVKPNIMFVLDDSTSMSWDYMPDLPNGVSTSTFGNRSPLCNTVYYNRALTYAVPIDYAGNDLNSSAPSTFTSAKNNGYYSYMGESNSNTNLTGQYYWTYMHTGTPAPVTGVCNYSTSSSSVTSSTTGVCCSGPSVSSNSCSNAEYPTNSPPTCSTGKTLVWKKTLVNGTSGPGGSDETGNFANWYSYYRTRMMMMKASVGKAFEAITNRYRVGFITINPWVSGSLSSNKFLKPAPYESTHRSTWYGKLYGTKTNASTPLREALSRVGRYYAGKTDGINAGMIPTSADDPVQYSCQQNFTILTTDGYWNGNGGQKLDGSSMDTSSYDSNFVARSAQGAHFLTSIWPMNDGASQVQSTVDVSNAYRLSACTIVLGSHIDRVTTLVEKQTKANSGASWTAWQTQPAGVSCTYHNADPYPRTKCRYATASPAVIDPACAPVSKQTSTNDGKVWLTAATCTTVSDTTPGQLVQVSSTTTTTSQSVAGGISVGAATTTSTSTGYGNMAGALGTCKASSEGAPAKPSPDPRRPESPELPLPTSPCLAWPCVSLGSVTGGSKGSLADVAQYYYVTDLRPAGTTGAGGANVSEDNVPPASTSPDAAGSTELDNATWQHMTTFTLGLGLSGSLTYDKDYKTASTGDFASIRQGTKVWPAPVHDDPTALDDLWHAAVNGRGQYFSASDPDTVSQSLRAALSGLNARVASAAAAATSNLEPVSGDNFAYVAKYKTSSWYGEVDAREIALQDEKDANGTVIVKEGTVKTDTVWSAGKKLGGPHNNRVWTNCDRRTIKVFRSGATNNLGDFTLSTHECNLDGSQMAATATNLSGAEQAYFSTTQLPNLGQYVEMGTGSAGTANQRSLAAGAALVNFIRGQRQNEVAENSNAWDPASTTAFYRKRGDGDLDTVLGDIANAQPLFVRRPFANYEDDGYAAFKSDQNNRTPMVYVAANDGMLHVLNGDTGTEEWAFIPAAVLPNLHRLADRDYATAHRYFVDGSPVAGDVFDGTAWRTIVVGGLNKGGQAYYALDVTVPYIRDPASGQISSPPKALWEFTHPNLGFSYGNPVIGKLADGTWAVFLTSGANNADGNGYLFILNAVTGALIRTISTNVGSSGSPSNLMKIVGWANTDPVINNTVGHVYGTDLIGNIWRFDVNNSLDPTGYEATRLITLTDSAGTAQPISTRPEVGLVGTNIFVFVGTGKYLGASDMNDSQTQSIYGIKDPMTEPTTLGGMVVTHGRADLTMQTLTQSGSGSTAKREVLTCALIDSGWYVDLPDAKERVNVDMKLTLGTLLAASNVPVPMNCNVGGYSWLNYFNLANGCSITNSNEVGKKLADALAVGINVVRLPSGKVKVIATTSDAQTITIDPPIATQNPKGRRLTWREITP
jgi:type IV pilus assembly protein PilY1